MEAFGVWEIYGTHDNKFGNSTPHLADIVTVQFQEVVKELEIRIIGPQKLPAFFNDRFFSFILNACETIHMHAPL
jgi:hypothetical protein